MHTYPVLHRLICAALPEMHAVRRDALTAAVDTVAQGARVSITAMGRGLASTTRIKHRIKRMDRLIGNPRLAADHEHIYQAIAHHLLAGNAQPILLIDWSDFSNDRTQQLLRASVPVGGRALTLHEELHPMQRLGNRHVQHRFLSRLVALLPKGCTPIIIADAGFRGPFFRYVERLGWHWLGRIRHRDFVCWEGAPQDWLPAKALHRLATPRAQDLGVIQWARSTPLAGRLILMRHPRQGRKDRSLLGIPRRSRRSRKHARRAREPWLLIASPSLANATAKQLVRLYKTRMQIEENFRDTKSVAYGLGIATARHTTLIRAVNLLLIAALATFFLWLIGTLARARQWDHAVHVSSSTNVSAYSALFLARLVIRHLSGRLPLNLPERSGTLVSDYLHSVWQTHSWG